MRFHLYTVAKRSQESCQGFVIYDEISIAGICTFQDDLKAAALRPAQIVHYGKIRFAYDEAKGRVFIQTGRVPNGQALDSAEIDSFEIFRDGEIIASQAILPDPAELSEYAGGEACRNLHIVIQTRVGSKIILPIIDSPPGYRSAYDYAAKAAHDIAVVLEGILVKSKTGVDTGFDPNQYDQPSNSKSSDI